MAGVSGVCTENVASLVEVEFRFVPGNVRLCQKQLEDRDAKETVTLCASAQTIPVKV